MFDVNSIYKIEDEYGMLIFSSNKKLASSTGIRKVNPETGNTLEIVPTNLIIKKNEKINEIYQGSERDIFLNPVKIKYSTTGAIIWRINTWGRWITLCCTN